MHSAFCCSVRPPKMSQKQKTPTVGLDLLLKTSGKLALGIILRAEHTCDFCPSLRASGGRNGNFYLLPSWWYQYPPKPNKTFCWGQRWSLSPLPSTGKKKKKTKEFIHTLIFTTLEKLSFYFIALRQSYHLSRKCWANCMGLAGAFRHQAFNPNKVCVCCTLQKLWGWN